MHRTHINSQRFFLGSLGSLDSSSGNNLLRVPRMLLKKTGSAASSRGRLLTVLQMTHTKAVLRATQT